MTELFADTGVVPKSERLKGITLFYAVCGSIGAVEAVKHIRELRRHGAAIIPVLSDAGAQFITPLSLEWAATEKPIVTLSGEAEHLKPARGMIICPATWNTLVELSVGLAASPVSTIAAIQIARKNPVFIVPTLHEEFKFHPRFSEVMENLQSFPNVEIYLGPLDEGRHKMPDSVTTALAFCDAFERVAATRN